MAKDIDLPSNSRRIQEYIENNHFNFRKGIQEKRAKELGILNYTINITDDEKHEGLDFADKKIKILINKYGNSGRLTFTQDEFLKIKSLFSKYPRIGKSNYSSTEEEIQATKIVNYWNGSTDDFVDDFYIVNRTFRSTKYLNDITENDIYEMATQKTGIPTELGIIYEGKIKIPNSKELHDTFHRYMEEPSNYSFDEKYKFICNPRTTKDILLFERIKKYIIFQMLNNAIYSYLLYFNNNKYKISNKENSDTEGTIDISTYLSQTEFDFTINKVAHLFGFDDEKIMLRRTDNLTDDNIIYLDDYLSEAIKKDLKNKNPNIEGLNRRIIKELCDKIKATRSFDEIDSYAYDTDVDGYAFQMRNLHYKKINLIESIIPGFSNMTTLEKLLALSENATDIINLEEDLSLELNNNLDNNDNFSLYSIFNWNKIFTKLFSFLHFKSINSDDMSYILKIDKGKAIEDSRNRDLLIVSYDEYYHALFQMILRNPSNDNEELKNLFLNSIRLENLEKTEKSSTIIPGTNTKIDIITQGSIREAEKENELTRTEEENIIREFYIIAKVIEKGEQNDVLLDNYYMNKLLETINIFMKDKQTLSLDELKIYDWFYEQEQIEDEKVFKESILNKLKSVLTSCQKNKSEHGKNVFITPKKHGTLGSR